MSSKNKYYYLWGGLVLLFLQIGGYIVNAGWMGVIVTAFLSILGLYVVDYVLGREEIAKRKEEQDVKARKEGKSELDEVLLGIAEEMGFDSQELLWLSKDNISTFTALSKISYDIDNYSEQNAASSEEINASVNELVNTTDILNQRVVGIERCSVKSIEMLHKNQETMGSISVFIGHLAKLIDDAEVNNVELQSSSNKIHEIVDYIRSISSQTNLLALNAAIEAARAGEAGRGFAVVASEIRKLAEQTNEAIMVIEEVINGILEKISSSNAAMGEIGEKMEEADHVVKESTKAIKEIGQVLNEVKDSVEELTKVSLLQKNTTEEIEKAIEDVTSAVEDTHTITAKSISLVETQSRKNEEMRSYAQKICDVAEKLQKEVVSLKKEDEIIFGVNPFISPLEIRKMYVPILERVALSMNMKARTIIVKNYDALSEGVGEGAIDVGWFSPFAYVNAKNRFNVVPVVTPKVSGKASYNGYIIARKGSGIKTVKDLKGKSFGYVDENSASGYLYARDSIKQQHMDPDKIFSSVSFLGNHDNVIEAILAGEVDAGATYNEALDSAKRKGLDISQIEIISKTEDIPKDVLAAKKELDVEIIQQLKDAFVAFDAYEDIETKVEGFIESHDHHYDVIRRLNH